MRALLFVVPALLGCETIAGYDGKLPRPEGDDASVVADGGDDAVADLGPCGSGTRCGTRCVDLKTDSEHCGACFRRCTGGTCADGACQCPPGQTACGLSGCVDTTTDARHCGSCTNRCPTGATCAASTCRCPEGRTLCGSGTFAACVDTATDPNHCKSCDAKCPILGICGASGCECPSGTETCPTACTDKLNDPLNCGGCDKKCGPREACVAGACTCRPGLTRCGTLCVDLQSDPQRCGSCTLACGGSNRECANGKCVKGCPDPLEDCDEACVDRKTNPLHCGSCGKTCATNELCVEGNCRAYASAVGCATCPCPSCTGFGGGGSCCGPRPGTTMPTCVAGSKCP